MKDRERSWTRCCCCWGESLLSSHTDEFRSFSSDFPQDWWRRQVAGYRTKNSAAESFPPSQKEKTRQQQRQQ
jgi:hypothetical protein